jgi:hypothetical protein
MRGISLQCLQSRIKKCASLDLNQLRELRQLCEANGSLKRLVTRLSLDRRILQ